MIESARRRLDAPKDASGLVAFRIALGVIVSVSAIRFLAYGWVSELFVKPTFYFTYAGFAWVRPLPAPWMHVVFVALAVLGACFAAGLFYRVVAPVLCALFVYVQLIDVTNWLHHYYLVALLLLLASFMPLGSAWSLDVWRRPETRVYTFPAWCTYLLRFQVAVVYFHAGISKLTSDWLLHAQPLNIWLSSRTATPLVGPIFDERLTAFAFSWGGFLFDTTIAAFLSWRRSRRWAYVVVVAFHTTVGLLFPIGMFPFIMVTAAVVFFEPDWPARIRDILRSDRAPATAAVAPRTQVLPRAGLALASAYCLFQLLFPLRHHLYGGNVLWDEQGMRFAWKVMVREKNGNVTYIVDSPRAGRTWYVDPRTYLTDRQQRELSGQPDLILALAHRIAGDFRAKGYDDVHVRVDALASLNGRPAAPMIDPSADLSRIDDGFGKATWILSAPGGAPIHLRPAWSLASVRP